MDTANPRAVMGGNLPPDPLIVEANERIDVANKWLVERPIFTDMETADKANFFISQITATFNALDDKRKKEKAAAIEVVERAYRDELDLLSAAKTKLADKRRDFLKREEDRLAIERRKAEEEAAAKVKAAEEAQRVAEEAARKKGGDPLRAELAAQKAAEAAQEAQAKAEAVPERAVIFGSYSVHRTGLRATWHAEITDLVKAFKIYKKNPIVVDAIKEAMTRVAKAEAVRLKDATKAPEGVRFWMEKT